MLHSIKWRTVISFTALILICIMGISGYLYHFFKDSYIESLSNQLVEQASIISSASESYLFDNASGEIDAMVKSLSQGIDTRITIIDADGAVLGDSDESPSALDNHADRPEVASALSSDTTTSIRYSETLGYEMLYVAVPISAGDDIIGCARTSIPLTEVESYAHHILTTIVWVSVFAGIITILLALQLSRVVTEPVHKLTGMARRISEGHLDQEIQTASRNEIGELSTAFNLMAAKIKEIISIITTDRDRMSVILSQMSDGIVLVDVESKISLVNNAAKNIFDISDEEAIGHAFVEAVRDYEIDELVRRCLQTKKRLARMVETSRPPKIIMAIATPLEGQESCLVLFQDLTEMKRLETIRRDFVSNISHELRLPTASVKALAETLRDGAMDDPEVARDFLNKINDEVDRLAQLVQELGELSRIESGQAPILKSRLDLIELIRHTERRFKPQADRAGIALSVDIPSDIPQVNADRDRIEQVLVNLLLNAVKFTPPGGNIAISASSSDDGLTVSVTNSGVGIPIDDLPRIFERFYKADKARGGGTGLGLSIAKHIVEAHGGEIWAESVEGKGATFTFTLPSL
ncbi:MAG: ATP-binding protein [Chloroflexota bacterium]|nr:ATP-binding protein [Chloroflexota bacterium]